MKRIIPLKHHLHFITIINDAIHNIININIKIIWFQIASELTQKLSSILSTDCMCKN